MLRKSGPARALDSCHRPEGSWAPERECWERSWGRSWEFPGKGLFDHNVPHSRPQRPRSFWSAPRIATSGLVQRHSGFEWICKHNRLKPEPIRFVRLDSEHAQSDGKSVNRELPLLDLDRGSRQRSRFLVLTKRSAASGDENAFCHMMD